MQRRWTLTAVLAAVTWVGAVQAGEAATPVTFFNGGTSTAAWETFTPAPPGATESESILLKVQGTSGTDYDDYAGVTLGGLAGPAPATPPSFYYYSDRSGGSGGSPRMVVKFSDGGRGELRPVTLVSGSWVLESGATNDWDNNGGTCGFGYAVTWAAVLACHPGTTVTSVSVVNDSGWVFAPGALGIHVDDIRYGTAWVHERAATRLVASPVVARVLPDLRVYLGTLSGTLTDANGTPIAGATISFASGGNALCSAQTNAAGVATCSGLGQSLSALLGLGYTATFAGDGTYKASSAKAAVLLVAPIVLF